MSEQGLLVVVSGFSGAGKGTLMKLLLDQYDNYALSISATTRNPREGELHGRDYFFKTIDEFECMIQNDELMEYANYVNNYYGTPNDYIFQNMKDGKDVILEIEIQGALEIQKKFPQAVLVFIMPPSATELKKRLTKRGTESLDVIEARMNRAAKESEGIEQYDYILINEDLEECVATMHNLIMCQHKSVSNNLPFIHKIREELITISGGK